MNTLVNLLSATAVILTGAFASSPFDAAPAPQSVQRAVATEAAQGREDLQVQSAADPQWLTISDVRGSVTDEQSPMQRWVF
ncbi:MAG: hypothetical protein ABWY06_15660 [Pseudomonas sp.]|uniref:hypothetical protein n=1 Tax=Pseudomonas sp. TaxID=306 RepID=UPI003390F48D